MKKILLLTIFLSSYTWSSGYEVCNFVRVNYLEDCVKDFMADGYVPLGGVSVILLDPIEYSPMYSQAMYKE